MKTLQGYGDAYNVTNNPSAMVHVFSLAVSIMLKQAGMEPVIQFTCRDRNRLDSGRHAGWLGVRHQHHPVPQRRPPDLGRSPEVQPVYDMDSLNVIRMARMMRNNQVFENGKLIPKIAPDFFIGAVENPFAPPYEYRPLRLAKRPSRARSSSDAVIFNVDHFRGW